MQTNQTQRQAPREARNTPIPADLSVIKLGRAAIKYHGLRCQTCGFDFQKMYGELGKDFIEVHHSQLLAAGKGKPVTTDPKTGVHAQTPGIFDCNSRARLQSFQKSLNRFDARLV